jgi:pimeloyl-ACP methyl ester carboxylesterase
VLLLPSLLFPAYGFRHVVPRLVDSRHRALVVDPLGLGRSTQPPSADYSSGAKAGRVARVLEAVARGAGPGRGAFGRQRDGPAPRERAAGTRARRA